MIEWFVELSLFWKVVAYFLTTWLTCGLIGFRIVCLSAKDHQFCIQRSDLSKCLRRGPLLILFGQ